MEFGDVIRTRRMVRHYRDEPVDPSALERILDAGTRAPSAGNTRGTSFVAITDGTTRRTIAELAGEPRYRERGFDPWISSAPVLVVVCASEAAYRRRYAEGDKLGPDEELDWPVPYWWVDAGAALMALLLATVDEGLAAGFLGIHAVPGLDDAIGLPEDVAPVGIVTIGHAAPDRRSRSLDRSRDRRPDVIHRERW